MVIQNNNQELNQTTIQKNVEQFEQVFLAYISTKAFNKIIEDERNILNGLFLHVRKVLKHETTMDEYISHASAVFWLNIIFNGYKQSKYYKDLEYAHHREIDEMFEELKRNC